MNRSLKKTGKKNALVNGKKETATEGAASIFGVLIIGLFTLTFVFKNFVIPSASMASTLLVGDHVLVDRTAYGAPGSHLLPYRDVKRGDVIVFYKPVVEANGEQMFLVKRVVGTPGDRIHLRGGIVYRNGQKQSEPFAARPPYADINPYRDEFPSVLATPYTGATAEWSASMPSFVSGTDLVVPSGKYFVMGDNRSISLDSRYWGFVPRENIIGTPLLVYWSFPTSDHAMYETQVSDQVSLAAHEVLHFFDETRWRRTFHVVR